MRKGTSRFDFGHGIFNFFQQQPCTASCQQLRLPELLVKVSSILWVLEFFSNHCNSPNSSNYSCPQKPVEISLWHESSSSLCCVAFFPSYRRDGKNCTQNHSCNHLQSTRNSRVYTGVHGVLANLQSEIVCSSVVPRTTIEQGESQSLAVMVQFEVWSEPHQCHLR